eukprot:1667975-Rhodomonas_salina.2
MLRAITGGLHAVTGLHVMNRGFPILQQGPMLNCAMKVWRAAASSRALHARTGGSIVLRV